MLEIVARFWKGKSVESGIDRGGPLLKRVEESVAESILKLSPALFGRVEFRRIRRQRDEGEAVTGARFVTADA